MNKVIKTNFKYLKPLIPLNLDKVFFIILHHTASKTATVEQIHKWHLEAGFNGFGYNEYITKDGTVYIGRGDHIGAQTAKHNSISYGICFEGNYDVEEGPSDESYKLIAMRVIETQKRFPKAQTILPHSARNNTSCPGKNFSMGKLYDAINDLIKEGEKMEEIKTVDEALKVFVDKNLIESPEYWKIAVKIVKYLDVLLIKFANYIVKL